MCLSWLFHKNPSKNRRIGMFIFFVFISQMAGIVGGLATAASVLNWYQTLAKPWFTPPNWMFGPVWVTLYALMGIGMFLVWDRKKPTLSLGFGKKKELAAKAFFVQLILNTIWSILFFGMRNPLLAFVEIVALWIAIVYTIIAFSKVSRPAAWIMIPYIFWVSIASALNLAIVILN